MLAQQGKLAELVQQHLTLKKQTSVSVSRVHRYVTRFMYELWCALSVTNLIDVFDFADRRKKRKPVHIRPEDDAVEPNVKSESKGD